MSDGNAKDSASRNVEAIPQEARAATSAYEAPRTPTVPTVSVERLRREWRARHGEYLFGVCGAIAGIGILIVPLSLVVGWPAAAIGGAVFGLMALALVVAWLGAAEHYGSLLKWELAARSGKSAVSLTEEEQQRAFVELAISRRLKVGIVGVGRVGSRVAEYLASVVGELGLFDPDLVQPENTVLNLTPYRPADIPFPKVDALKRLLLSKSDHLVVETYRKRVVQESEAWLRGVMSGYDYVVLALDDPVGLSVCNAVLYGLRVPYCLPALHERGARGLIALVERRGPCLACAMGIESFDDVEAISGGVVSPTDLGILAATASSIVIERVLGDQSGTVRGTVAAGVNLVLVENRANVDEGRNPRLVSRTMQRRRGCVICAAEQAA